MSDWDHVCALGHFLTGGDLVNGMNNVGGVVAVSAHITNANRQILQNDKAIFMLERFAGDFLGPNRSFTVLALITIHSVFNSPRQWPRAQ